MSLVDRSLREISEMLRTRKVLATELLNDYLSVALKGSCITFCSESAFEMAKAIDKRKQAGVKGPALEGIPFSAKDNIRASGLPATCNSRILKPYIPDYNAFIIERLSALGAILTAKNCMREFSVGKIEDSAFELRNYLDWAGTNKNVNIGAFSIGTDIGLCDYYCGLWTFKPTMRSKELLFGVITGSPSLEKVTLSTRRADDLRFIYPHIIGDTEHAHIEIDPRGMKVLVYDNLNMPDYTAGFLEECGFSVTRSECRIADKAELIYDCILSTEFFTELYELGAPEAEAVNTLFYELEHLKNRSEGFGFETKRLILTGAYLLSSKNKSNAMKIIASGAEFASELSDFLGGYDFIAAPALYGDTFSKASAVAALSELCVPFGDVLPFKIYALPGKERLLLDLAVFFEKRL